MGTTTEFFCNVCEKRCNLIHLHGVQFSTNRPDYTMYEVCKEDKDQAAYHICHPCVRSVAEIYENDPLDKPV